MSPLQTQYPLSPRKFWKKMIPAITGWLVLIVIFEAPALLFGYFSGSYTGTGATDSDLVTVQHILNIVGFGIVTLALIVLVIDALYYNAYIKRYYYSADDNFITIKKGVFAPAEIHVQYAKIQDVYVDQDLYDRFMGLYDVHIASATVGSAIEAHIDGVEHEAAEGLKNMFLQKISGGGQAGGSAQNMPASGASAAQVVSAPVVLSEPVSSVQFPIASAWVVQSTITYFISALVLSGIIMAYFVGGHENTTSLLESVNISIIPLWFVLFLGIFIFHIICMLIWKSNYYFEYTPDYILLRTGVFSRSETHMPYRSVQDVNVTQGIIERMFGLATVKIDNAAAAVMVGKQMVSSGITIPGQTLASANRIAEITRSVTLSRGSSQTGL